MVQHFNFSTRTIWGESFQNAILLTVMIIFQLNFL